MRRRRRCDITSSQPILFVVSLLGLTGVVTTIPLNNADNLPDMSDLRILPPKSHVALEGDVHISTVDLNPLADLRYRLRREDEETVTTLRTAALQTDAEDHFSIPCGYFSRGGVYIIDVIQTTDYSELNETLDDDSIVNSWRFEVKWPTAKLSVTPEQIQTYPQRAVTAILEFPGVVCTPVESTLDFWLELLYCGHSSGGAVLCDGRNISSHAHVLSSEQVRGFPGRKTMQLRCELFGQAGDYALILRPAMGAQSAEYTTAYIKADWSEEFVLNVHGGSVFPCNSGVKTLFQYPACVLEGADRVRVFGKEGARLRYVAESRVKRGQHSTTFDCRLFTERYPEYCFVYVSQAVTGAVADVRMDCIPTLPLSENSAGAWGPWSAWSPCPQPDKCTAASRSRHRFCDRPPPQYGAKYCEGPAVEISSCECHGAAWTEADSPAVVAEVGVGCRCGCTLHLGSTKRLVAASTSACPSHSFWLLKAEPGKVVRLLVQRVVLPCPGQRLQARSGETLASPLVAAWTGAEVDTVQHPEGETPTDAEIEVIGGRYILLDLRNDDTNNDACAGGFIAHATQIEPTANMILGVAGAVRATRWWTSRGQGAAFGLALTALLAAIALALHSRAKHHKYQRASDKDQLTDSDACTASLEQCSGSKSTLFSAVSSPRLRRLLPQGHVAAHERLRESVNMNDDTMADTASITTLTPQQEQDTTTAAKCKRVSIMRAGTNVDSEVRLEMRKTQEKNEVSKSAPPTPTPPKVTPKSSPLRRAHTCPSRNTEECDEEVSQIISPAPSAESETAADMSTSVSSMSEREHSNWSSSERDRNSRYLSSSSAVSSRASSAATLTKGQFSPKHSNIKTARVRDSSAKHYKERGNKKRSLRASDLSLNPEMEMDYYDYEVDNAGCVPGSYLGMDPAFLVWIPPIEDPDQGIDEDIDEDLLPTKLYPESGCHKESPMAYTPRSKKSLEDRTDTESPQYSKIVEKYNVIHPLNFSASDLLKNSPLLPKYDQIQMKNLKSESTMKVNRVMKAMDDIKFADENSDSSCEIKYADEAIDSNKLVEKYGIGN